MIVVSFANILAVVILSRTGALKSGCKISEDWLVV